MFEFSQARPLFALCATSYERWRTDCDWVELVGKNILFSWYTTLCGSKKFSPSLTVLRDF